MRFGRSGGATRQRGLRRGPLQRRRRRPGDRHRALPAADRERHGIPAAARSRPPPRGMGRQVLLTVLDFIGQAHQAVPIRPALPGNDWNDSRGASGGARGRLPPPPAGCSIQLDRVARDMVLENVEPRSGHKSQPRRGAAFAWTRRSLAEFLRESRPRARGRLPAARTARGLVSGGRPASPLGGGRGVTDRGPIGGILHWDDPERLACYLGWIQRPTAPRVSALSERERRMAVALVFALLGGGKKWKDLQTPRSDLGEPRLPGRAARAASAPGGSSAAPRPSPSGQVIPGWSHPVPLSLHSRYSQAEILTAFDLMTLETAEPDSSGREVRQETKTDLFFVTLEKSEQHYRRRRSTRTTRSRRAASTGSRRTRRLRRALRVSATSTTATGQSRAAVHTPANQGRRSHTPVFVPRAQRHTRATLVNARWGSSGGLPARSPPTSTWKRALAAG